MIKIKNLWEFTGLTRCLYRKSRYNRDRVSHMALQKWIASRQLNKQWNYKYE
jgi:hypothetical protein